MIGAGSDALNVICNALDEQRVGKRMPDAGPKEGHIWVNPEDTQLPIEDSTIRFAVGTPSGPSTNSWRVWTHGDDVYVKCRDHFAGMKASLHASGRWRFGSTQEFARSHPDLLDEGRDRALTKVQASFDDPTKAVTGFQVLVPKGGIYLQSSRRKSWPKSVLFVEPPEEDDWMTVVSVAVAKTKKPVRMAIGTFGAVFGILPLSDDRTAQVIANYEKLGGMQDTFLDAFRKAVGTLGGEDKFPEQGVFFVHGRRGEDVPWVSAVRFLKGKPGG